MAHTPATRTTSKATMCAVQHWKAAHKQPLCTLCAQVRANMPLTCRYTVPKVGLEPTHLSILHFECSASAIPPLGPST